MRRRLTIMGALFATLLAFAAPPALANGKFIGFASTDDSKQTNLQLSLLRVQQSKDLMAAGGIAPARLMRVGEGEVNTVGTAEEARRVEIIVRTP